MKYLLEICHLFTLALQNIYIAKQQIKGDVIKIEIECFL